MKILNSLICEDVRSEANGKQIIIGVYNSDIQFTEFPATFACILWMQVEGKDLRAGGYRFRCRLDEENLLEGKFNIGQGEQTRRVTIPLGPLPMQITREGLLSFQLAEESSDIWQTIVDIPITKMKDPLASREQ